MEGMKRGINENKKEIFSLLLLEVKMRGKENKNKDIFYLF